MEPQPYRFPGVSESLYRFLDLENCRDIESLRTLVKAGREKASGLRLDGGQITPVLDLYNKLDELLDQNDVFYNFKEFKLLVKFPNLTPYMYEIVEARERTIADLARVAQREYGFRDQYDFLFSYFLTMYSKFGIYDNGIRKMMKESRNGSRDARSSLTRWTGFWAVKKPSRCRRALRRCFSWPTCPSILPLGCLSL